MKITNIYIDGRKTSHIPKRLGTKTIARDPKDDGVLLFFHPFRLFTIYHLFNRLGPMLTPSILEVFKRKGHTRFLSSMSKAQLTYLNSEESLNSIEQWNALVTIGVIAEPGAFSEVFGRLRMIHQHTTSELSEEQEWMEFHRQVDVINDRLKLYFYKIGLECVKAIWYEFNITAQLLDRNTDVQILLRIGYNNDRLELVGTLGAAILMRTAAEMIRRIAEKAFSVQLPEEDEYGISTMSAGRKKRNFGSERLLDDEWEIKDEFARSFKLRYGHYLRWYVEGKTEFHAIKWALKELNMRDVTIVPLLGSCARSETPSV